MRVNTNTAMPAQTKEDSSFGFVMPRIPVLGAFFCANQEKNLVDQINGTEDVSRLIELINLKNKYLFADVDRTLITGALAVAGVAVGIIESTCGYLVSGIMVGSAAYHVYKICHNNQVVKELRVTGVFRPGMKVL